ncbi:MAG TPA: hypothetical protein GX003_03740 [Acholeplasmataceae bacterium]|nr:hypothetical protein [Acholeplasmataceae bacterium]
MKTNTYEELFNEVKGLTWLPWVGSNYNENRLLLVGESHYAQGDNGEEDLDCYNSFLRDKNATISIVEDVLDGSTWNFFTNTHYALTGNDNVDREAFWKNVAFYNFIQRPMHTTGDRPSPSDYKTGWEVFFELLKVIKPTHCIFLGSGGSKYLWPLVEKNDDIEFIKDKCTIEQWDKKIGRFFGKVAHLEFEDVSTDITFIRHPSAFFKKEEWHNYLMEKAGPILKELQHKTRF